MRGPIHLDAHDVTLEISVESSDLPLDLELEGGRVWVRRDQATGGTGEKGTGSPAPEVVVVLVSVARASTLHDGAFALQAPIAD